MHDKERIQLRDEITAGDVRLKDLSGTQLKALREDWSMDYVPDLDFFGTVVVEMERRERTMSGVNIMKAIDKNFFGVRK
jgi:hypothetical protein